MHSEWKSSLFPLILLLFQKNLSWAKDDIVEE